MATFESIADALYGLDPSDFVAARTEFAAEARKTGDRELTAAVARMRKPTVAAWTVNLLARERTEDLEALADLGAQFRDAQRRSAGHELRKLAVQRQRLLAELAHEAQILVAARGRTVTETALREVSQTLGAALADSAIAARILEGRLAAVIDYDGLGALPTALSIVTDGDTECGGTEEEATAEQLEARAVADRARKALDVARAAARDADDELARHDAIVADLRRALDHAEQQHRFAQRTAEAAHKDLATAERAAASAGAVVGER